MSNTEQTIRDLTASVGALTRTIAERDAREQATRRRNRRAVWWLGVTACCALGFGLYLGGDTMRRAEAANADAGSVAQQLAQLNQMLGQMLGSEDFGNLIRNGAVLTGRLKQDSDALRLLLFCAQNGLAVDACTPKIQSGELQLPPGSNMVAMADAPEAQAMWENLRSLQSISSTLGQELEKLNAVLAAVPGMYGEMTIMRADMNAMNANMAIMAGSMGSTMGRMGSWMPW